MEQLRKHGGGGLVERTTPGDAEHGRIRLPFRRKSLALEDGKNRSRIVHGFDRAAASGSCGRVRLLAVGLLGQVVDHLEDGRLDLFGLLPVERAACDVALRELEPGRATSS